MVLEENFLPRSFPEAQGVASSSIYNFLDAIEANNFDLHSFMLLRHGKVISEGWWHPYKAELPHMLFSLSKSFTSTAIGFAVSENLISTDSQVISFFPDDLPNEISMNLSSMLIKHLLCMGTGHAKDTTETLFKQEHGNWVKAFLSLPVEHTPGSYFVYNSGATYILSAIIQKVAGQTVLQYLTPRLFKLLGIEGATWEVCPRGINTGGWGLSLKTEDIAKFGQFYLQKGRWKDKQLLPEEWIDEATSSHISNGDNPENDWNQGYCYQFWRCRHEAYRGDGAFGQYCIVLPNLDTVIAITSGIKDMQAVLNLIWQHLLPGITHNLLPTDPLSQEKLKHKLLSLELLPQKFYPTSPTAARVSGITYKLEKNKELEGTISFNFYETYCVININNNNKEHIIRCGIEKWVEGETSFPWETSKLAASGTWSDENTFIMIWRFTEKPFNITITCNFNENKIILEQVFNVSMGPNNSSVIEGYSL